MFRYVPLPYLDIDQFGVRVYGTVPTYLPMVGSYPVPTGRNPPTES